jgi:type IV pilus assembly protein PilQ
MNSARSFQRNTVIVVVLMCLSGILFSGVSTPASNAPPASLTAASKPVDAAGYLGEPVSLKLVDVTLVDFFRAISELTGLNLLIDPDVNGTITINVEQVPWDLLFDTVLRSHGLQRTAEANLVRISTKKTLRQEEEAKQALKKAAFLAADTQTVTVRLNYAVAKDLAKSIEKQMTERGQINVDERTNTIILTDISDRVSQLTGLLRTLDVPEQQVEIEARIIEATTTFARELGFQLGIEIGRPTDRAQGALEVFAPALNPVGAAGAFVGRMLDTFRLDAIITAGEARGEARILSKPRVSAQNNAKAIITQGAKIPIPVQQNFTTTVRFETAALQLTVTPQVTEEETVLLNIKVDNNVPDFTRTVLGIPVILTSESETIVLVPNGGTTVIGGIFVEIDRRNEDKVPGLGDIPVVGNLFKRSSKERETREILFFITPRIK